jgi:U3 small nucleolar RNA-associated protein 11
MSSLRNAVKRVTHKERAQPRARAHMGLLEKKKDYKLRAKDYHLKEDRIKAMREKASMKNPDEFYFGMHNAQIEDGHHRKTKEFKQKEFDESIGVETIRIMKDQDLSYIRMQKQKDARKVERLQSSLHYVDEAPTAGSNKRKHTIFVDSQADVETFNVAEHFKTLPEMAGRAFNRPRVESLRKTALQSMGVALSDVESDDELKPTKEHLIKQTKQARLLARKIANAKSNAYGELEARSKRVAAMERAESHLVTEKLVAGKGRKRKIKDAEQGKPAQYKWRRKRMG